MILDEFDKKDITQEKTLESKQNTALEQKLKRMHEAYQTCKKFYQMDNPNRDYIDPVRGIIETVNALNVTPDEITAYVQAIQLNGPRHTPRILQGRFITDLIHSAHTEGYNHFIVPTKHITHKIKSIGNRISGNKKNELTIIVDGDCGDYAGHTAKRTTFHFHGTTGSSVLFNAEECTAHFYEPVAMDAGGHSRNCTYYFHAPLQAPVTHFAKNCEIHVQSKEDVLLVNALESKIYVKGVEVLQ